jgi:hypothetical protein
MALQSVANRFCHQIIVIRLEFVEEPLLYTSQKIWAQTVAAIAKSIPPFTEELPTNKALSISLPRTRRIR